MQRLGQVDEVRALFEAVAASVETGSRVYQNAQKVCYDMAKQQL
jgi:hypothetical protein